MILMDLKLGRQWWALPWSETSYSQSWILHSPGVKSYCCNQWTDHWWLCSPFCKCFQHTNKELNMILVNLIWYSLPFLRTAFAGNAIWWSRRMIVQGLFLWTSIYWSRGPCDLNNNSTYHSVCSLGYFTTYLFTWRLNSHCLAYWHLLIHLTNNWGTQIQTRHHAYSNCPAFCLY